VIAKAKVIRREDAKAHRFFCAFFAPSRLCVAFLFFLVATATAAPNAADAKRELQQLRGRIEALQKQLASSEESRNEAADALRESERAISDANRELADLSGQSHEVSQRIAELRVESDKHSVSLRAQQERLARMLFEQYIGGQAEPLRLILNGENPNDAARQLHYLTYVSRARADSIRDLRAGLTRLKDLATEAQAKAAELAAIVAGQTAQKQRLEREKRSHAEVLARLARDIQKQQRDIGAMKRNESRLTNLIEQLARIIARTPPRTPSVRRPATPREKNEHVPEPSAFAGAFSQLRGQLALPVRGELVGRFGSQRSDGGLTWKGLFMTAAPGEPVKAVAAGRVVYADWLRGFGNLLIVDHGEGYMSLYGYNETLYKRVGEEIATGDTVAAVGSSGGNGESGLYFELRHRGQPFDPLTWVTSGIKSR
jgi:septal ring factor EnvC (AmiA/AmiB activator)